MDTDRDFDLVDATYDAVAGRADRAGIGSLSDPEQVLLLTWWTKGVIDQGGFVAFYKEALHPADVDIAFDALGFPEAAAACRRTLAFFPKSLLTQDRETRCQWMQRQPVTMERLLEARLEDPILRLDGYLERALATYIRQHQAAFSGIQHLGHLLSEQQEATPAPVLASDTPPFYVLRPYRDQRFGRRFAYADVLDPHNTAVGPDRDHCPCCADFLGSLQWLPPHRIRLSSSRYPDLLWGAGFGLMVSGRFRELYEAAGLKGIKRFDHPAEIVKVGSKLVALADPPPPIYHNVWYLHGGADVDDVRSGARRPLPLQPCSFCRQNTDAIERVVLQPGTWTGADLFVAFGLAGTILVTERFKAFAEEHQITNAEIIPAEEYYFDFKAQRYWRSGM